MGAGAKTMESSGYQVLFDISSATAKIVWMSIFLGVFGCIGFASAAVNSSNKVFRLLAPLGAAACLLFALFDQVWMNSRHDRLRRDYSAGRYEVVESCRSSFQRDPSDQEERLLVVGERRFRLSRHTSAAGFDGRAVPFFENVCARAIVVQGDRDEIVWLGVRPAS